METAVGLARLIGARLSLVHAWRPFCDVRVALRADADDYARYVNLTHESGDAALEQVAASCRRGGVSPDVYLWRGDPLDVSPAFVVAEGIDLLLVGAPQHRGFRVAVRARTAERLLDRVGCSVLAVKRPIEKWARTREPRCTSTP